VAILRMSASRVAEEYRKARKGILDALGPEAIAGLHRACPALDWAAVVALPVLFVAGAVALATWPLGFAWILCFGLQGCIIQTFGYLVHDLFVHRRVGGRPGTSSGRCSSSSSRSGGRGTRSITSTTTAT
jgi:hypothetical protein